MKNNQFPYTDEYVYRMYPFFKRHPKELETFKHKISKTGLDMVQRHIYPVLRNKDKPTESVSIQTSIEGLRLIAERTGNYAPGRDSTYDYDENGVLVKATSYIKKRTPDGTWHEISANAFMSEYKPEYKPEHNANFWNKMPHVMLAKVAEAAAIRRAFPDDTAGLYTAEEMDQADEAPKGLTIAKTETVEAIEYVSDAEANEIEEILKLDEMRKERLLNYFNVDDVRHLPKKNYPFILETIKSNRKSK